MIRALAAAGVIGALAAAAPAVAQGNSQNHKNNPPPSRSDLTSSSSAPATATVVGATPFAWIDDASLLEPGAASIAISVLRWQGNGVSEVDLPVMDAAIGLAPRVHLAMTVPRVIGSGDAAGALGGVGTSYFSAKIAVLNDAKRTLKLSVAPTLEVLGRGVLQGIAPGARRAHFGVPVSAEIARGAVRLYGGAGYFSRGVWFTGAGVGRRASKRTYVTAGYSRSWRGDGGDAIPISDRDRNELNGAVSYAITSNASIYGSIARTIATLEENGAGTSLAGGLSLFFAPAHK